MMRKEDYLKYVRRDVFTYSSGLDPFFDLRNRIPNNRNYANGRQDVTRFRRAKENKSDGMTKDLADLFQKMEERIDWTPQQILSPKLNVAVTLTAQKERTFFVRSIDEKSHRRRKDREAILRGGMLLSKAGIPAQAIEQPIPQSDEELIKMADEETVPIERAYKQAIEYILYSQNNYYTDIEIGLSRNLMTDGLCVMKIDVLGDYTIKPRICDPVNMFFAMPETKNFEDCTYFCERIFLTIDEIKRLDREKEYKDKDFEYITPYGQSNQIRKYSVLDIEFRDIEKIEGVDVPVWRKCKYVEGANDMILDYGILDFQGMGWNNGALYKPKPSFIAYCPYIQNSEKSVIPLVEKVIPNVDAYYITNINKQFEKANAPTRVVSYSIQALAESANLFKVTPREILLYQRAMGINFRAESMPGSAASEPSILDGGLSSAYNLYLTDEQQEKAKIDEILGVPAGVDASLSDPNQSVYSQKLAAGGVNNALFVISESLNQMFSMAIKNISLRMKYLIVAHKLGAIKTPYEKFFDDIEEALMVEDFMTNEIDFSFVTMPNQEAMEKINMALDVALQSGQILVTDKIDILMQAGNDLEYANSLLEKKIRERESQQQQVQVQAASAAAEANAKSAMESAEKELEKIRLKGEIDEKLLAMKISHETTLKGSETGGVITKVPTLLKDSYSVTTTQFLGQTIEVVVSENPEKLYDFLNQPVGEPKESYSGQKANGKWFVFILIGENAEKNCMQEAYSLCIMIQGLPNNENYREFSANSSVLAQKCKEIAANYMEERVTNEK